MQRIKLRRISMLPLLLVYIAEYTINQGVAPNLLFPLESSPFDEYRSFYSTYGAIYQFGVFISRSSTPFVRIHNLYLPSLLQVGNLILLTLHGKQRRISVWRQVLLICSLQPCLTSFQTSMWYVLSSSGRDFSVASSMFQRLRRLRTTCPEKIVSSVWVRQV